MGRMTSLGMHLTAPLGPPEGRMLLRPYSLPAGGVFSYGRLVGTGKRVEERIAGVTNLPILVGIGEAEYVWILICFKGLKAFSCRQGRGVLNTPSERPHCGRMGLSG